MKKKVEENIKSALYTIENFVTIQNYDENSWAHRQMKQLAQMLEECLEKEKK